MIRLLLLTCLLFIVPSLTHSQTITLEGNPLLRYLYHPDSGTTIVRFMNEGLEIAGPTYTDNIRAKTMIRNKNGLFLMIYGKGRVYRVLRADTTQTVIERIDSTLFFGNNFNSIDFSWRDTLFSFGGYGFWRFNGQLRYFIDGSEWNIARLNAEEPTNSEYFLLDDLGANLYYIQTPLKQEYTSSHSDKYYLCKLDLSHRTVTRSGELKNPELISKAKRGFAVPGLNGIMIESESTWYLLQPATNQVLKLVNQSVHNWFMAGSTYRAELFFADAEKIYSYSKNEDTLRSVRLTLSDFKAEPGSLYIVTESKTNMSWLWTIPALVLLIAVFMYRHRINLRKKNDPVQENDIASGSLTEETEQAFTEVEKSLIQSFLTRKGTDNFVTVEELNYWLGLSKKSLEIQKKVRRETLNRINSRFRELCKSNTDLIQAERSEMDRRYYNYYISRENSILFNSIINLEN